MDVQSSFLALGRGSSSSTSFTDEQKAHLKTVFDAHKKSGTLAAADIAKPLADVGLSAFMPHAEELSRLTRRGGTEAVTHLNFDQFIALVNSVLAVGTSSSALEDDGPPINRYGSASSQISLEPLSPSEDEDEEEDPAAMAAAKRAAEASAAQRMAAAKASLEGDLQQLALGGDGEQQQPSASGAEGAPNRRSSFGYESAGRRLSMDL